MKNSRIIAQEIFQAALQEASPEAAVRREARRVREVFRRGGFTRLFVIGFGKAAPIMAHALTEELGELDPGGLVITKYGHGVGQALPSIQLREAGHPVPDDAGVRATEEVLRLLEAADARTLVCTLISGGGSALLVSPAEGITLAEKQRTTTLLLESGADIVALNTVRKHLSRVKGGRLAALAHPATVIALILSDVIGDPLDVIASGPTAPDPTTYADALEVLDRLQLTGEVPPAVAALLRRGVRGELAETPKAESPLLGRVTNIIVGSNSQALQAAARKARALGCTVEILTSELSGEAQEAAAWLADQTLAARRSLGQGTRLCLLSGGETTVTVHGNGKGGRNMELALAFALQVEGEPGVTLLSAGTDGTDGPTDAAGAIVDGATADRARHLGLDPSGALRENDSWSFFRQAGGLLVTGPTGTNVMDVQIALIERTS